MGFFFLFSPKSGVPKDPNISKDTNPPIYGRKKTTFVKGSAGAH